MIDILIDALLHAIVYVLVAYFFGNLRERKASKVNYMVRFEDVFIYLATKYSNPSGSREAVDNLKSELLWLERHQHYFCKKIRTKIKYLLDYLSEYNGTFQEAMPGSRGNYGETLMRPVSFKEFAERKSIEINDVILDMKKCIYISYKLGIKKC